MVVEPAIVVEPASQPDSEPALVTAVRWDLVHSVEGWSLQPAISWLVAAGRNLKDMKEVVEGSAKALRLGRGPGVAPAHHHPDPASAGECLGRRVG